MLVRARREIAGLTQRELAGQTGMSVGAVRDIEQGRTVVPRARSLARLGDVLGLSGNELDGLVPLPGRRRGAGEGVPEWTAGEGLVVAVLGPLRVWRDGAGVVLRSVRQRAVLGLLALHQGAGVSRDALLDALWGENPPPTATGMLQGHVSRLRRLAGLGSGLQKGSARARGGGVLSWDGASYRLDSGVGCDLTEFGELASRARRAAAGGDAGAASGLFERALALWLGEPLADVDVLRGHPALTALSRRRVEAVIGYADAAAAAGRRGDALGQLRVLAEREPLDERVHARLMAALAATGQQAAALGVYAEIRLRLDRELGVRPGRELADAQVRVLRQQIPAAAATRPPAVVAGAERPAAVVVPRQLPACTAHFAGRAAELAALDGLLDQAAAGPEAVLITVVGGPAGVGKTTLAISWAHRIGGRFPDGQLYVSLRGYGPGRSPLPAGNAVRGFLDALGVPPEHIPADLEAQTALYRSLMADRQMLILLDNARDAAQVRPLLPGTPGNLVVVTSRSQLTSLAVTEGASQISLDLLTGAEARELLASWLGPARLAGEPEAAAEIAGLCARLPLALAITAARAAARPGVPLAAFAAQLRQARERLDVLATGDTATDVRAVLSWSCQNLDDHAARMFRLLGLHPGPDISAPAAASLAGTPLADAQAALRELTGAHLLTEHVPGRYAFHDLLRAYATEQASTTDSDTERQPAIRRMLDHYLHTGYAAAMLISPSRIPLTLAPARPGVSPEELADREQATTWFEAERQVLLAVTTAAASAGFDTHAWQIPWTLATFLQWQGHWSEYAATQRAALAATQRLGDLSGQASAHYILGLAVGMTGSYDEARDHMAQSLVLGQQLGDPVTQARSHEGLGWIAGRRGHYTDALEHAQLALELLRAAGHRAGQSEALNATGWFHAQLGDYKQALASCQEALALGREAGDPAIQAGALDSIGYAHHHLGHHVQALASYQQALHLYRQHGHRHETATVLHHLGDTYFAIGDLDVARHVWRQALDILDELNHADADAVRAKLEKLGSAACAGPDHLTRRGVRP